MISNSYITNYTVLESNSDTPSLILTPEFVGSFAGAFFAFVFGIFTYMMTKRRERFINHRNALIKLERVLNKHLDDLETLEFLAKDMIKVSQDNKVSIHRFFSLKIPDNLDDNIGSVDLINKFLMYQISVDRLNLNTSSINKGLIRIEDLFINGQVVPKENFDLIISFLKELLGDLSKFSERVIKFLAFIRIHNNKLRKKNSLITGVFKTRWEQNISENEIKNEIDKVNLEITRPAGSKPNDLF